MNYIRFFEAGRKILPKLGEISDRMAPELGNIEKAISNETPKLEQKLAPKLKGLRVKEQPVEDLFIHQTNPIKIEPPSKMLDEPQIGTKNLLQGAEKVNPITSSSIRIIDPVSDPNFELGSEFSDIEADLRKQLAELKIPITIDGSEISINASPLDDIPATSTYRWRREFAGKYWTLDRNIPLPRKSYIKPSFEGPNFTFARKHLSEKLFSRKYRVFVTDPITKCSNGFQIKVDNITEEVLTNILKKISSEPEIVMGELGQYSEALDKAISFFIETKSNFDIIENRNLPILIKMLKDLPINGNGKLEIVPVEIKNRMQTLLRMIGLNNNKFTRLANLTTDSEVSYFFDRLGSLSKMCGFHYKYPSDITLNGLITKFSRHAMNRREIPIVENFTIQEIEDTIEKLKPILNTHSEYLKTFDGMAENAADIINNFVDKHANTFASHGLDFDSLYVTPPKIYDEYLELFRNLKLDKKDAKFEATLQDLLIDAHYGKDNVKDFEVEKNKFRLSIKKFWKFRKGLYNVESGREVHGICNELTAIYASHLQEIFPEKVFIPVCDASTFGIKHWFIACFDRTDPNLEKFGKDFRINLTQLRDESEALYYDRELLIDKLFENAIIIDPSPGIYGKYGSEEVAHYKIDAISSLDQIIDRVQEENPLNIHCDQAIILGWVKNHVDSKLFEELLNKFPETTQILFSIKGKKIVINGKECITPTNEINVHRLIPGIYGAPVDPELKQAILNDPKSSLYKFIKNYEAMNNN